MFEIHFLSQEDVIQAGQAVLNQLGPKITNHKKTEIASLQVITNVNPYQAQLLNRFARGMMLVPGQAMLVLECAPAVYINLAANEADILAAHNAAVTALNQIEGILWKVSEHAKKFLTAKDIDYHADQGVTEIHAGDDVVVTDLGQERARERGVRLIRLPPGEKSPDHPACEETPPAAEVAAQVRAASHCAVGLSPFDDRITTEQFIRFLQLGVGKTARLKKFPSGGILPDNSSKHQQAPARSALWHGSTVLPVQRVGQAAQGVCQRE